jgi:hypothetical protein
VLPELGPDLPEVNAFQVFNVLQGKADGWVVTSRAAAILQGKVGVRNLSQFSYLIDKLVPCIVPARVDVPRGQKGVNIVKTDVKQNGGCPVRVAWSVEGAVELSVVKCLG